MTTMWLIAGGAAGVCASACLGIGFAAGWLRRGRDERWRWRDAAMSLHSVSDDVVKTADGRHAFGILAVAIATRMLDMADPGNIDADASRLFDGLASELGASLQQTDDLPVMARRPVLRDMQTFRVIESSTYNTLGASQADGGGDGE